MRCTNCGTELVAGAKFCHACGTRAEAICLSCGNPLQPEYRFCPQCGTAVGTSAAPPAPLEQLGVPGAGASETNRLDRLSRHIPEDLAQKIRGIQGTIAGERKLVTVLFCDLVGSTAIAERLDPEEYRDLLDRYLELAFAEIYRFEGIVNQLAGDGMMALFGAPVAHEDAPYRAVRAACEIQIALEEFNRTLQAKRGFELRARIGIHTGPVVVGTVGNDLKMDYTAIGDTTNLAARLQSLAQPGTIIASEATERLVRGFFRVEAVGPFTVKGKREPVAAYQVLGRSEITTSFGAAEARGLTPMVGRDHELAQLRDTFARVQGGLPHVVTIVGGAGSGKSRLLFEFRQTQRDTPTVFLEGRCSALKQKVPYSPFMVMLRQFFSISVTENPALAREKIASKVRPFDPGLDQIFPFLCRMLSVDVGTPADLPADEIKRETFHALARLVMAVSEQTPVALVIEDLHWIDDASREVLELSVQQLTHARLMMVFTHRPDFHADWRARVPLTQLSLRALSDDDTRVIIRAVAGAEIPRDLEARILTKAEGSPFFAEEITRALIEEGYLVVDGGHATLTRPTDEVLIPGTVREVIAARIDRLGTAAKRAVQVASVLGRQFHRVQLAKLLSGSAGEISGVLATLEDRGILHRKNVLSDDEYRFGESLTQEVAYDGLLLKERRQMHERIAGLLEAEATDDNPERHALLAHHYVRSDNRRKALDALLAAARHAESLPSYPTATDLYRQAWEVGYASLAEGAEVDDDFRKLVLEAGLQLCRMAVVYIAPDSIDVEQIARTGLELADALADLEGSAGFRTYLGMVVMGQNRERFAEGLALIESGYALAEEHELVDTSLRISRALAFAFLIDGQIERARQVTERLLEGLEARGHARRISDTYMGCLWTQNSILAWGGDDTLATLEHSLRVHDLAVQANNRTARAGVGAMLALCHFARGEYEEAIRWADQSLEIAEAIGNAGTIRLAAAISLGARSATQDTIASARYLRLIEDGMAMSSNLSLHIGPIVDVLLSAGEVARAERAARLALERAGGRLREMHSQQALGEALAVRGSEHHAEAAECFERSAAIARGIGLRSMIARAQLGLGSLHGMGANGHATERLRLLGEARATFTELGLGRFADRAARLIEDDDGSATAGSMPN